MSFPHVPPQRQGENRASRCRRVDDMFTVLDEAESVSFSDLPKYVSDNPDKVLSTRLYEGHFRVLMSLFEKCESKLNLMESAISNIARDMLSIRSKVIAQESSVQSSQQRQVFSSQAGQCVVNNTNSQSVGYSAVSGTDGLSAITTTGPMTTGNSVTTQLMNESADPSTAQVDDAIPTQRSTDWPSLVSTPLIHNNRFSALATTIDDECSDPSRFEEQRSARIKRRPHSNVSSSTSSVNSRTSNISASPVTLCSRARRDDLERRS